MMDEMERAMFDALRRLTELSQPLTPVEFPADPYSLCWCGSGAKWKFCHKDRAKARQKGFGEIQRESSRAFAGGACLHPGAAPDVCSGPAIDSHTVQKGGGLAAIAEQGKVMSVKKAAEAIEKNDGKMIPQRLGVRLASVFPGFCKTHDNGLFKPVESTGAVLDGYNAFLLTFRAAAYELAMKEAVLRTYPDKKQGDAGLPFAEQAAWQTFLAVEERATTQGVNDVRRRKKLFDDMYLRNDYSGFRYYAVTFDRVLPVVASGAFVPEFDFEGRELEVIGIDEPLLDDVTFNLTTLAGRTVALFGWAADGRGHAAAFVDSFSRLPDEAKAGAAIQLAFEHLDNLYFKPGWWEEAAPELRQVLERHMLSGMAPGHRREAQSLLPSTVPLVTAAVAGVIDGRHPGPAGTEPGTV